MSVPHSLPVELAQLRPDLERLWTALDGFDLSGSAAALQKVARLELPADLRATASSLQELIDDYEFNRAGEIVKEVLAGLPEGPPS